MDNNSITRKLEDLEARVAALEASSDEPAYDPDPELAGT